MSTFFGVRKQELTPKQVEEAADKGLPFINYPHLHRQIWAKEYFRAQAPSHTSISSMMSIGTLAMAGLEICKSLSINYTQRMI